jgi:glycerol kinase
MKDDARLIGDPGDAELCARRANPADRAYFVPAFTGLGAPYWDDEATGLLTGVTRTTGHDEIVRACLESIAYQIGDVVDAMRADTGLTVDELRVDGGPTANGYLMQFQADVSDARVSVSSVAELSAAGAAQVTGLAAGLYHGHEVTDQIQRTLYQPTMEPARRARKLDGWRAALAQALHH